MCGIQGLDTSISSFVKEACAMWPMRHSQRITITACFVSMISTTPPRSAVFAFTLDTTHDVTAAVNERNPSQGVVAVTLGG